MSSAAPIDAPALSQRSLGLDLLRIFAAVWVTVFHWSTLYGPSATMPEWASAVVRGGYLGVDLFFMLSGAVIAHSAMNRTWHGFARARFLRLFPAFFAISLVVAIALFGVRALTRGEELVPDTFVALTGLTFWTGGGIIVAPAWTLELEVQFYLLIAILVLVSRNKLTPARLLAGSYVYFLVWLLAQEADNRLLSVVTIHESGPLFVLGALLGISTSIERLRVNGPAILIALTLTYHGLIGRTAEMGVSGNLQVVWILCVMGLAVSTIMWASLRAPGRIRHPHRRKQIQTLSLMTYPIYLLHFEVGMGAIRFISGLGVGITLSMLGASVLVLTLSWLSVRVYEPWARRVIRRTFGWNDSAANGERVVSDKPEQSRGRQALPADDPSQVDHQPA